jgi:hypothetical protein
MDTMDELLQLDDKSIVDGQVKNQLYLIKEDWRVPDLTWRFVENGGVQDESGNNIFTNIQSAGSLFGVGNHGFVFDTTNPSPPSSIYLEQDGALLPRSWLAGHINVLVKKRTKAHPKYINPTVEGLGQLIDGGELTAHCREYLRTYASATDTTVGGVAVVVWKLDRMARSMREGITILSKWCESGVRVVSVTQQIDLCGTVGHLVAGVLFGIAEIEREHILGRQAAGIAAAKGKGVYAGRKKGTAKAKPARARSPTRAGA